MWIRRLRKRTSQKFLNFQFRRLATGEPVALSAGQMYGLPSSEGVIFVAIAFVMLLTASTYSNNLMFAVSFIAGALFLILPSFVYRNIRACRFSFSEIAPVFLGEKAHCHLTIASARQSWGLAVCVDGGEDIPVAHIDRSLGVNLSFTPQRRGEQAFPPVRISSAYPMGLFNLWGWMKNPRAALVYPKPEGQPLDSFFRLNNQRLDNNADTDLQYWQHRDFQPGDSYSRVDWVRRATTGKMYVREYRPTTDALLRFSLDQTRMPSQDLEARLSQLCLWICEAEGRGLRYSLVAGAAELDADCGSAHLHNCLETLARIEPGQGDRAATA